MNLSLVGRYYNQYTLSNNNGAIVINDSTVNAPTYGGVVRHDVGSYAFDVCRYASYPSVSVTVTGDSVINGDVEVSASGSDAKQGLTLNLESGTLNGDIVLDETAEDVIAATPDKASVNKKTTFTQEAPLGYEWVGEGTTQTLAPIADLALKHSISLNGNIDLNFYLNPTIVEPGDVVTFTWGDTDEIIDDAEGYGTHSYEVKASDLTDDGYKVTVSVPAAEMTYDITATYGNVTDIYSVRDYCDVILADNDASDALKDLVKATLKYGAAAQLAFGVNTTDLADDGISYDTDAVTANMIEDAIWTANHTFADDLTDLHIGTYKTTSLFFLTNNVIRHYFKDAAASNDWDGTASEGFYSYIDSDAIAAADLDTLQTFSVNGETFKYSALDYVKKLLVSANASYRDLAAATYWYNQAANVYFNA